MHLLLDENVPNSVAESFRQYGHTVDFVRDLMPPDSPDPMVATVSEDMGAVLVSMDTDFKNIAPRIARGARRRFRNLSRIGLMCNAPQAAQRVEKAMTLIEAEYEIAQSSGDSRMIIVVGNSFIRTQR